MEKLNGSLAFALNALSEQSETEYRTKGCSISVYDKGAAPKQFSYNLRSGEDLHTELIAWAKSEGWSLRWNLPHTWSVFADAQIQAESVVDAMSQVIDILRDEGKPVRLMVFEGNAVMEVISSELTSGGR